MAAQSAISRESRVAGGKRDSPGLASYRGATFRRIKADERTRLIPLVVLTSSREERDLIETYKLGINSHILKPVDFDPSVEAVSTIGFYWTVLNEAPVS